VMSTAEQGGDISKPWFSRTVGGARDASEDEALLPVFLPRLRSTRFGGNRAPRGGALFRRGPPGPSRRGGVARGRPSVPFLRGETVKKKRELFPGPPPASQGSVALPQASPWAGAGILTRFPFDRRRNAGLTLPPPRTLPREKKAREGLPPPGGARDGGYTPRRLKNGALLSLRTD